MELARKYYEQKKKPIDESVQRHITAKEQEFYNESSNDKVLTHLIIYMRIRNMRNTAMSTYHTSIRRSNSTSNLNQIGLNTLITAWHSIPTLIL